MATATLARRAHARWHLYVAAVVISLFIAIPMYLLAVAAFTPRAVLNGFPKPLVPIAISADTMQAFLSTRGVAPSVLNSLIVGLLTLVFSTVLGAPAGYALARFTFKGHDAFQLLIL